MILPSGVIAELNALVGIVENKVNTIVTEVKEDITNVEIAVSGFISNL